MNELKILVGDDHKVIFDGVQAMLKGTVEASNLQYAASIEEINQALDCEYFDLLVLDLNINGCNSLDYMSDFTQLSPETHILIFTSYANKTFIMKAKEAGARGYLVKNTEKDAFCALVKKILTGGTEFPLKASTAYKTQIDHPLRNKNLEGVSERECEIISLLQDGNSDQEIADTLFISYNTVRTHKKNIFKKLEVRGSNGLIKFLQQQNTGF